MFKTLANPVFVLTAFTFFIVGNATQTSIYLWYIITGIESKSVDAILGLTAIFFMLFEWINYEIRGSTLMFRIINIICSGLIIASIVLFITYGDKHLPYHFIWPWSHISLLILTVLLINFIYVQFRCFYGK